MLQRNSYAPAYLTMLFVAMLGILVAAGVMGLALQDMTRSYVAGEGYYSKGHMAAVSALHHFARTGDPAAFSNYEAAIAIPVHDGNAREILEDPNQPREASHPHLIGGLNHPDDVAGMSWMFRTFSGTYLFAGPLAVWRDADGSVRDFMAAAEELRSSVTAHGIGSDEVKAAVDRIQVMDARLQQLELDFSRQMGRTARELVHILTLGLIGLGLVIACMGVYFVSSTVRKMRASAEAEHAALQEAKSQRSLLKTALESLNEGVTFFDDDLRLLIMNRRAEQILALPEGQFGPGTFLGDVLRFNCRRGEYGDVDEDTYVEGLLDLARQCLPHEFTRERPDGTVIQVSGIPVPTGGFVTAYRDISHEYRSRIALSASQQRTREVIDHSKDAFVSMDEDGRVFDWNPAAEETFGWSREEALGALLTDLFIPEEYCDEHRKGLERFLETGEARMVGRRFETEARHRSGQRIPVEIALGMQSVDGRHVFNAFIWDISERRKAEEELTAARNRAEVANHSKSEFLANMSHELRTPLNAIIGFSEMMKLGIGGEQAGRTVEYAKSIYDSGTHLLALINDILDLSSVEMGKIELDETVFSLGDAIETCLRLLQHSADRNRVRIENMVPVTTLKVCGDDRRMRQILLNLLGNAVKFSPEGGCVRIWSEIGPGEVSVHVADDGPGMDPETAESIFTPFVQLNEAIAGAQGGAGLGLAIVKRFVELHQGTVSVSTAPGKGTTMRFTLPITRLVAAEADFPIAATNALP
ncbi:MAG: PAS-domain containing protein [Minwuia sp.]|nr:PAS-domain containing protein [Minwuia sp.]